MLELRASDLVPAAGTAATKTCRPRQQNRSLLHPASGPGAVSLSIRVSRLRPAEGCKCTTLLYSVPAAGGAARCGAREGRGGRGQNERGKMTGISQSKLRALMRAELRSAAAQDCLRAAVPGEAPGNCAMLNTRRAWRGGHADGIRRAAGTLPLEGRLFPNSPGTAMPGVV